MSRPGTPAPAPLFLSALFLTALAAAAALPAVAAEPLLSQEAVAARLDAIRESRLEPGKAVALANLTLGLGGAILRVESGTVFPATPTDGQVGELVFLGEGRLQLDPPDDIEAGQLQLFTDAQRLDTAVTEAVLVLANPRATAAILNRPPAAPDADAAVRAQQLFARWQASGERRGLEVTGALLRASHGDPLYQSFVGGYFPDTQAGDLVYQVEPESAEQVTLGQLVPFDLSDRERRKALREIARHQRRGRFLGLTLEDLGQWDTWVSTSLAGEGGARRPGFSPFEPRHYDLEVRLDGRKLDLAGRARIRLESLTSAVPVVRLEMHPDLTVSAVRSADGQAIPFHQEAAAILAFLPQAPAAGSELLLDVDYGGKYIEKLSSGIFQLRDPLRWYPRAGSFGRATHEVSFEWPDRFELIAGGQRVDGGERRGGQRWERRRQELPSFGFTFEIGRFHRLERQAGHIKIELAIDPVAKHWSRELSERILDTTAESLAYFEGLYGPYPLDELRIVTTYRPYSQATLGFLTLSNLMTQESPLGRLLGQADPRAVIAHEVAHQWWGHRVGWSGYRDQWISEALANYSANLYQRDREDEEGARRRSLIHGWQSSVLAELDDGRPVESVGPVVLGERLISSRTESAYLPIVYSKGALVFNMLATWFGEEAFHGMLRSIAALAEHRALSTETFLAALEKASGQDLEAFADQFVFGIGLPEVYYSYDFARDEAGKWKVRGEARQLAPYHFRYRVIRHAHGSLDVGRERLQHLEVSRSRLVVPLQMALYDPGHQDEENAGEARERGNARLDGRLWLEGETTSWEMEVPHEPRELWLDRGGEVFALFYNERRHPKRMLYYQALNKAAEGAREAALGLCTEALEAPVWGGLSHGGGRDRRETTDLGGGMQLVVTNQQSDAEEAARWLDGQIQLLRARLHLDAGETPGARAAFEEAEDLLQPRKNPWHRELLSLPEARLALQSGDGERAFRLLRKQVLRKQDLDSTEAWVLLAIAASETGHPRELAEALAEARRRGADVSLLEAKPESGSL